MSVLSPEPQNFVHEDGYPNRFPAILCILLALVFPLFFVLWGIVPVTPDIYVQSIALFGILFLILFFFGNLAEKRWPEATQDFYAAYLVVMVPGLTLPSSLLMAGMLSTLGYALALSLFHIAVVLLWLFGRKILHSAPFKRINRSIINLMPLSYSLVFWLWLYKTYGHEVLDNNKTVWWVVPIGILFISGCWWVWSLPEAHPMNFRLRPVVYILAIMLLVGLVYRPDLYFHRWHYNYFLAPVNDVLHGKMIFANTTSLYGMGVIYFLAGIFRIFQMPLGYYGLSFMIAVLFIVQYVLLGLTLLMTTKRIWVSLIGLFAIVYFNYLSVSWTTMLKIPAQSPLRYGWIYLLLFVALINANSSNRFLRFLEFVLLGIASVWSLETFLYTLVSLDAFYFIKDVLSAAQFKEGLKIFFKRILLHLGVIGLSWGILLVVYLIVVRQLPNPQVYLDYFLLFYNKLYVPRDVYAQLFRTLAVTSVYLGSIFLVLFDRLQKKNLLPVTIASMMGAMSVAGILQYFYYFIYNLEYHFALLCIPLIFVLTLWMAVVHFHGSSSKLFRLSTTTTLLVSLLMCGLVTLPRSYKILSKSLLYEVINGGIRGTDVNFASPYELRPTNKSVEILSSLIGKYSADDRQIAIFAKNEDEVEALLLTGKTHILDISDPEMSSLSPEYTEHIIRQAEIMSGQPEFIFYDNGNKDSLLAMQQDVFQLLTGSTDYIVIDGIDNILVLKKAR